MIIAAIEADGPQIQDIAARAGVFSQEEVECVADLWEDYLSVGPVVGGYNFIVDRDGDQVLGFRCRSRNSWPAPWAAARGAP
jgi:hypothetical protein